MIATALRSGRVLLMDGAMGTELQRAGITPGECYEAWNLTHPDTVRAVHRAYVDAGAEVLLANVFQANPPALTRHHLEESLAAVIQSGLALARAVLPPGRWLLADIGPWTHPCLSTTDLSAIWPTLNACRDADAFLLETFSDAADAAVFARANRSGLGPKKPLLVSFTFDGSTLRTFRDTSPEKCAQAAADMGATALGVNCGRNLDISACAEVLRRYRAVTDVPLFARPNAGTPTDAGRYPFSPQDMAARLPLLLDAGAAMIGGCCGTTPEHIQAFRPVIDSWNLQVEQGP
jgi:5-methyltetrahydrofolate--homocysteine methyltransferase